MNDEVEKEWCASPAGSAAEVAAASWIAKLSSGEMSEEQRQQLRLWLEADPEHRRHFRAMQAVWQNAPVRSSVASRGEHARRAPAMPFAAAAAALLAIIGVLYFVYRPQYVLYTTDIGEQLTVNAADGSVVNLNTGSEFALRLSDRARTAQLRHGEAFFSVQPDLRRPFEIDLDGSLIRVVGTRFNVRTERDYFSVTVVDGVVRVEIGAEDAGKQPQPLTAGQRLTYRYGAEAPVVEPSVPRHVPEWVSGKLSFNGLALPQAVAEARRYLKQPITIADERLNTVKVSGVFRVERLDEWVSILEEEGLVRTELAEDGRSLRLYAP